MQSLLGLCELNPGENEAKHFPTLLTQAHPCFPAGAATLTESEGLLESHLPLIQSSFPPSDDNMLISTTSKENDSRGHHVSNHLARNGQYFLLWSCQVSNSRDVAFRISHKSPNDNRNKLTTIIATPLHPPPASQWKLLSFFSVVILLEHSQIYYLCGAIHHRG